MLRGGWRMLRGSSRMLREGSRMLRGGSRKVTWRCVDLRGCLSSRKPLKKLFQVQLWVSASLVLRHDDVIVCSSALGLLVPFCRYSLSGPRHSASHAVSCVVARSLSRYGLCSSFVITISVCLCVLVSPSLCSPLVLCSLPLCLPVSFLHLLHLLLHPLCLLCPSLSLSLSISLPLFSSLSFPISTLL